MNNIITTKDQYHRLHHLERAYNHMWDSELSRPTRVFYCDYIAKEIAKFSDRLYLDIQMSFSWRDEPMSGWVNNDRRMRWNQLREMNHNG